MVLQNIHGTALEDFFQFSVWAHLYDSLVQLVDWDMKYTSQMMKVNTQKCQLKSGKFSLLLTVT